MGAYNRANGEACCASETLLQTILRREWAFDGYVVSDCWAISDIYRFHGLANTVEEAAALAVRNGCDLNCGEAYLALLSAVDAGLISEREIDVAVERLMTARFRLGMFDGDAANPYAAIPISVVASPEHAALAREAAVKSIVLLKNDHLLPLAKDGLRSVALVGPLIDDEPVLLGNYHGTPRRPVTLRQGIAAALGPGVELGVSRGCPLADGWPNLSRVPAAVLSPWSVGDASSGAQGLSAAYFANAAFFGGPALSRVDSEVDFVWRDGPPLPYLGRRPFSVRWTGALAPVISGLHRLAFRAAGRFSVWLDGRLVIHGENQFEPGIYVGDVELEAGRAYDLRIDYVAVGNQPHAQFLWATPGQAQVEREQALAHAASADVVIACLGLSPELEGEEMPVSAAGFDRGDRTEIALPQPQQEFLEALYGLGKPLILVLLSGSAISIPWAAERVPAILEAWYPGEQGGHALADILFGTANPSGRLPVTVYRSLDDLPPFDDYAMTGRTYRYFDGAPLYAFGHGLSYTRFAYNRLRVEPARLEEGGEVDISVDISNVGEVAGEEVAQLYVRYPSAQDRPFQALKGFARVRLDPGETAEVRFPLTATELRHWDGGWQLEEGELQIAVGASSADIRLTAPLVLERRP
jgi:beta-glucosidase